MGHELHTDRLVLRQWRHDDRGPWASLNADAAVMEHFPSTLSRAESDAFLERQLQLIDERGWGLWAVEVTGGASFIGFVGLAEVEFDAAFVPATEIGWRLAREHWGRGYATEAARAALDFAFASLALHEVVSFTAATNARSEAVMSRIGMVRDHAGDFHHPRLPLGHRLGPHVLYRIERRAWAALRAG